MWIAELVDGRSHLPGIMSMRSSAIDRFTGDDPAGGRHPLAHSPKYLDETQVVLERGEMPHEREQRLALIWTHRKAIMFNSRTHDVRRCPSKGVLRRGRAAVGDNNPW